MKRSLTPWLLALLLLATPAFAHKPSDSYLHLTVSERHVSGRWDIALRDLEHALGLDADQNGEITWGEVRNREQAISAYALARLRLGADGENACVLRPGTLAVDHHSDGAYAVLSFTGMCLAAVSDLTVEYRLFFDLDPQHRGLATITSDGLARTAIFGPDAPLQRFDARSGTWWRQLLTFGAEGVWHIWIGIDHLLFLLALLLPSMVVRTPQGWQPVARASQALWPVVAIVTSFTVAHSITLSLAAVQFVSPPARWVETAIAASVFLAAINNLCCVVRRRLWLLAFAFGLVHGFGFAGVLLDLGLPREARVFALLGFNLGVEVGQLAVVALYVGLAALLLRTRLYGRRLVGAGSALIAVVAVGWLLERALDLNLFPS